MIGERKQWSEPEVRLRGLAALAMLPASPSDWDPDVLRAWEAEVNFLQFYVDNLSTHHIFHFWDGVWISYLIVSYTNSNGFL